jgi:hypothetical protein
MPCSLLLKTATPPKGMSGSSTNHLPRSGGHTAVPYSLNTDKHNWLKLRSLGLGEAKQKGMEKN